MRKIKIIYATRSLFKKQEIAAIEAGSVFLNEDGKEQIIGERFQFVFSDVGTDEPLEVDLAAMVRHKAISAYRSLLMPCIVEHAGIILEEHIASEYPGGLTQPMMNSWGRKLLFDECPQLAKERSQRRSLGIVMGCQCKYLLVRPKVRFPQHPKAVVNFIGIQFSARMILAEKRMPKLALM